MAVTFGPHDTSQRAECAEYIAWTVERAGREAQARVRLYSSRVELRVTVGGEVLFTRQFPYDAALHIDRVAEETLQTLRGRGWTPTAVATAADWHGTAPAL